MTYHPFEDISRRKLGRIWNSVLGIHALSSLELAFLLFPLHPLAPVSKLGRIWNSVLGIHALSSLELAFLLFPLHPLAPVIIAKVMAELPLCGLQSVGHRAPAA
ncbi:hypothetical protein K503DRAFT_782791 [Rhizopogon vinicolor AM-OR11-026]|uniref:Uncharacterized protein n=1 Tax=Rhizopogon vinicolor AM-OR11-026 TaxID=1314800 RepID=A0A1B7N0Z4_9AGAM|nr:hypothetical protein K503DRAFT_782791 [Rhizopogon vinicolor AM-OR11-026]